MQKAIHVFSRIWCRENRCLITEGASLNCRRSPDSLVRSSEVPIDKASARVTPRGGRLHSRTYLAAYGINCCLTASAVAWARLRTPSLLCTFLR